MPRSLLIIFLMKVSVPPTLVLSEDDLAWYDMGNITHCDTSVRSSLEQFPPFKERGLGPRRCLLRQIIHHHCDGSLEFGPSSKDRPVVGGKRGRGGLMLPLLCRAPVQSLIVEIGPWGPILFRPELSSTLGLPVRSVPSCHPNLSRDVRRLR